MKKFLFCIAALLAIPVAHAGAADVGVNIGVNVGVPAPVYVQPPVVITEAPNFIAPPQLGFYIAVGVPYDLFYLGGRYYLHRGNVWYSAPYYNGPWTTTRYRKVPYGLRRHSFRRIHHYRDYYYRNHRYYHRHEYRHFRPEHRYRGREYYHEGDHGRGGGNNHGHRHR